MESSERDGAAADVGDPLELVRARSGLAGTSLEETLAWARARADEILAKLSPDSELLTLLRDDDRPVPDAAQRRRTREWIPALLEGLPPRPEPKSEPKPAPKREPKRAPEREPKREDDAPKVEVELPVAATPSPAALVTEGRTDSMRAIGRSPVAWIPTPPPRRVETGAPPLREHPRYAIDQPVEIQHADWGELVELVTKDISRGGMFVVASESPPLRSSVEVRVGLPKGAGTLTLSGEIVHVVTPEAAGPDGTPGFGLQFAPVGPERMQRLEQLLVHARAQAGGAASTEPTLAELGVATSETGTRLRLTLSAAEQAHLRELQVELAALRDRDDRQRLGLATDGDPRHVRAAFEQHRARWRERGAAAVAGPEVRAIVTEAQALLKRAHDRLVQAARARVEPEPEPEPTPEPVASSNRKPDAAVEPRIPFNRLIGTGFEHLSSKRYAEAIATFSAAVAQRPDSGKAKILLLFAEARQLITEKKLDEARAKYEAVLEIDPANATAQRDLVMLSCLI